MKLTQNPLLAPGWNRKETKRKRISQEVVVIARDVPIPHFKPIPILLSIPAFRVNTDTADTTDTFLSIEHHQ